MTLKSIITRTATIALAAAALAAPAASARPAEAPPATAAAQDKQGLRSSDANGAGSRHKRAGLRTAREYPTRPAQGELANPRPDASLQAPADPGITWTPIAIGFAGSLLAVGAIGLIASRGRRPGRARITT